MTKMEKYGNKVAEAAALEGRPEGVGSGSDSQLLPFIFKKEDNMKSARINFGIPGSEYILKVDHSGAATSLVNQDTGTEYVGGGGGGIENVTLVVTNGRTGNSIYLPDYFEPAYPSIINNTLQAVPPEEVAIEAQASYTLNIAHSSGPTEISMPSFDDEPVGSGNVVVTYDEESELYKLSISGDCAITILPKG